jgi:hypothetical protein
MCFSNFSRFEEKTTKIYTVELKRHKEKDWIIHSTAAVIAPSAGKDDVFFPTSSRACLEKFVFKR